MVKKCTYFNSIKVRLELVNKITNRKFRLFQFHKGTIRTGSPVVTRAGAPEFQFHKGTIRTVLLQLPLELVFISIP